jgi:AraC-like DNA-binding protein
MRSVRYCPPPPLNTIVDYFWWSQRDKAEVSCEHMLPSGSASLVFALHEAPIACLPSPSSKDSFVWFRGIVHGPQTSYFVSGRKPSGTVVGVSFRPGAAGAVLGVPIAELTDRHVTIDELWGPRGRTLHERLLADPKPPAVFELLEQYLTARLGRPLLIHPAVAYALAFRPPAWPASRVADIQRQVGCSHRHFIALFRSAVGLPPKHYFRIKRFTAVLQRLANGRTDLADLAASVGYSDQSHMSREFHDFAGITPTQYRPRGADSVFHHRAESPGRAVGAR